MIPHFPPRIVSNAVRIAVLLDLTSPLGIPASNQVAVKGPVFFAAVVFLVVRAQGVPVRGGVFPALFNKSPSARFEMLPFQFFALTAEFVLVVRAVGFDVATAQGGEPETWVWVWLGFEGSQGWEFRNTDVSTGVFDDEGFGRSTS